MSTKFGAFSITAHLRILTKLQEWLLALLQFSVCVHGSGYEALVFALICAFFWGYDDSVACDSGNWCFIKTTHVGSQTLYVVGEALAIVLQLSMWIYFHHKLLVTPYSDPCVARALQILNSLMSTSGSSVSSPLFPPTHISQSRKQEPGAPAICVCINL